MQRVVVGACSPSLDRSLTLWRTAAAMSGEAAAPLETVSLREQKRMAVAYLVNERGVDASEAARIVGFARAADAAKWATRMTERGHVRDDGAKRGPARLVDDTDARALGEALSTDVIGSGAARVAKRLVAEGVMKVTPSKRTLHRSLERANFSWPADSPDLSPIENLWAHVEHELWTTKTWSDLESFKRALRKAWAEVTADQGYLKRLCGSFEKRRKACIESGGKKTKY